MTTEVLPLEALSPRELLLERAGGILQRGAFSAADASIVADTLVAFAVGPLDTVDAGKSRSGVPIRQRHSAHRFRVVPAVLPPSRLISHP